MDFVVGSWLRPEEELRFTLGNEGMAYLFEEYKQIFVEQAIIRFFTSDKGSQKLYVEKYLISWMIPGT